MKKFAIIFGIVLLAVGILFVVKPSKVANAKDFALVYGSLSGAAMMDMGVQGDYVLRFRATPELIKIANKKKTVTFLSIENPKQYVEEGYVLVNVIPGEIGSCLLRIFYGTEADMDYDKMYAVELCE